MAKKSTDKDKKALTEKAKNRQPLALLLMRKVGAIDGLEISEAFSRMARVKMLKEIKETKAYKQLGKDIDTWADFCKAVGISRQKADQDLQNYALFGEEFLQHVSSLGLGYRQLRTLRKLPQKERVKLVEKGVLEIEGRRVDFYQDTPDQVLQVIDELNVQFDEGFKQIRSQKKTIETLKTQAQEKDERISKLMKPLEDPDGLVDTSELGRLFLDAVIILGKLANIEIPDEQRDRANDYFVKLSAKWERAAANLSKRMQDCRDEAEKHMALDDLDDFGDH